MRVLKFLAYLCLIGFVVDFLFNFFDLEKSKALSKQMGTKANLVLVVDSIISVTVFYLYGFETGLIWFALISIISLPATIYFYSQHTKTTTYLD